MRLATRSRQRPGITLLEVIVATAVLLFAMAALLKLSSFGSNSALAVRQKARATELASSKMAEVVAGIVPLSSQDNQAFDDDDGASGYQWSMEADPVGSVNGLYAVTVTVSHSRPGSQTPMKVALSRMVLTPSYRGNIAVPGAPPTDSQTQASSSSNSSSSNSSSPNSAETAGGKKTGGNAAGGKGKTTTGGGGKAKGGGTTGPKGGGGTTGPKGGGGTTGPKGGGGTTGPKGGGTTSRGGGTAGRGK
jgi:general secretion pathway protein I